MALRELFRLLLGRARPTPPSREELKSVGYYIQLGSRCGSTVVYTYRVTADKKEIATGIRATMEAGFEFAREDIAGRIARLEGLLRRLKGLGV